MALPRVTPGRLRALRIGAFVIVTAALVYAIRKFKWARLLAVLVGVKWQWVVVGFVANTGIIAFWGLYWRALLPKRENVSYGRMVQIGSIAWGVMNSLPFGAGHATGFALLQARGGVSPQGAAAVVALDQLGEGLVKVLIFVLAALFSPLPDWMRKGVLAATTGVVLLLGTLILAAHRAPHPESEHARRHADREHWWSRVWSFVIKLSHAMDALRDWRQAGGAFLAVAGMRASELAAVIAVQHAFGIDLPVAHSLLVLAAVMLGTMLPISPGNVGAYEAAVYLAYSALGVDTETALGLAVVQHGCLLVASAGIGYVVAATGAVVPVIQERRQRNGLASDRRRS